MEKVTSKVVPEERVGERGLLAEPSDNPVPV